MAVRPVDPLGDDIKGNSCWHAEPALYQLETIAAIHEGTFELRLHIVTTHVCEEHVATNQKKKNVKGCYMSYMSKTQVNLKTLGHPIFYTQIIFNSQNYDVYQTFFLTLNL